MFHVKRSREGEMFHVKQEEGGVPVSGGGLPSLPPADLAFSLLFCPHPPDPRSQSALPGGKGEIFGFLMQGAPPLASPGRSPDGIGFFCRISAFCPHPPDPLPGGKGEIFVLFCRGLTPPAPLLLNPRSTGSIGGLAPPAPLLLNLRGAGLPGGSVPCIPGAEPGRH